MIDSKEEQLQLRHRELRGLFRDLVASSKLSGDFLCGACSWSDDSGDIRESRSMLQHAAI